MRVTKEAREIRIQQAPLPSREIGMRKLHRYINLDLSQQNFAYIVTRAKYDFRSVAAFLLLLAVC